MMRGGNRPAGELGQRHAPVSAVSWTRPCARQYDTRHPCSAWHLPIPSTSAPASPSLACLIVAVSLHRTWALLLVRALWPVGHGRRPPQAYPFHVAGLISSSSSFSPFLLPPAGPIQKQSRVEHL
uniref:Uncharacterized protein n=1 Tax=Setaria viridis TaxID=4556 RepID=A0A4U6VS12_SETVI|nr:hypothetical protein SEVIR_2G145300v2 [Setaria viridis]